MSKIAKFQQINKQKAWVYKNVQATSAEFVLGYCKLHQVQKNDYLDVNIVPANGSG